jgi:DNA repair protein RecN (Recombination protein N)
MLASLYIENMMLIEKLTINFSAGFTAITGETGAGKSIVIDCIGLILGERAKVSMLRSGCDRGVVVAEFDITNNAIIKDILNENDISSCNTLTVKKVIRQDGTSKVYINEMPSSVNLIAKMSDYLMEISGQFSQGELLKPSAHLGLLDSFAFSGDILSLLKDEYQILNDLHKEYELMLQNNKKSDDEKQYLQQMMDDLLAIDIKDNEEEDLVKKRKEIQNAAKISSGLTAVIGAIKNNKIEQILRSTQSNINKLLDSSLSDSVQEKVHNVTQILERCEIDISEAVDILEGLLQDVSGAENKLDILEDRLHDIRSIARKYGCLCAQIPSKLQAAIEQMDIIHNFNESCDKIKEKIATQRQKYLKIATEVSQCRKAAAVQLSDEIHKHLQDLMLEKVRFFIDIQTDENNISINGIDSLVFMASMNPGSMPMPIHKIASGGELSRLTLAFKAAICHKNNNSAIIFDEIDTGVSGGVSAAIGQKMQFLAQNMQIIAITHSHQVACLAAVHFIVRKIATDSTLTTVQQISGEERVVEIAKMLSSGTVTDHEISLSRKMLNRML